MSDNFKPTVILTVGLPRSGKSTWAKKQGFPIVNRDSIRLAFHGHDFISDCESFITVLEENMVKSLILAGHNKIIIDATHTTVNRRDKWVRLLYNCDVIFKYFDTPADVCKARALADNRDYLLSVIDRMSNNFEELTSEELSMNSNHRIGDTI